MQNFQETFETRKRSFIVAFSICMTVPLSNTKATFEAQFMKELSNTEAGLKKSVAYEKTTCMCNIIKH